MSTSYNTNYIDWRNTVCVQCDHFHSPTESCASKANTTPVMVSDDLLIGRILGEKYRMEEKVGAGGMCQVYRATQVLIGKTVAIKLLHPQLAVDQQFIRRFEIEASALGRISNPHAISVFDFGFTSEGCPYLVMDFISGRTLDEVIRLNGPLPVSRANKLLSQICSALQAAHSEGIIHRDIKPENILISESDGEDWATVVDFGIAKLQEDINHQGKLTAEGIIIGTPRYMSPEQSEGKDLDSRSDIYSMGVVLYEMLAGEAPFTDSSSARLLIKHISEMPPPLRQKRPDISKEIESIVMSALAKDPDARPASALELGRAFEEAAANLIIHEASLSQTNTQLVVPLMPDFSDDELLNQDKQGKPTQLRKTLQQQTKPATGSVFPSSPKVAKLLGKALAILTVVVLIGLGLSYYQRQPETIDSLGSLKATQQTITQAINQISPLPKDNLLRDQLPELREWQQELERYGKIDALPPAVQTRIQTMEKLAREYTEQARLAAEQLTNATTANLSNAGSVNDSALLPEAEEGKQAPGLNEKAKQTGTTRNGGRKRVKGPNKFTKVVKKILLIP